MQGSLFGRCCPGQEIDEAEDPGSIGFYDNPMDAVSIAEHAVVEMVRALPPLPQAPAPVGSKELRWMNYVIRAMWPKLRGVVTERVSKELQERIQSEVALRPQLGIDAVSVAFDIGETPPTLNGLKTRYKSSDAATEEEGLECLQLQADVSWKSGSEFKLKPDIKTKSTITINMSNFALNGVEVRGCGTLVLAPLTESIPCFGAAQVFFFDPPEVVLRLQGLKGFGPIGKIMRDMIRKTMVSVVMDNFVLPHRFMLKINKGLALETLVKIKSPLPFGLLEVELVQAEGLIASDRGFTGKPTSDPYVQISVGDSTYRSSTAVKTISPRWDDGPDYLCVWNLNQLVRVEIFDDDTLTEDDSIGRVQGLTVYWLCKELEGSPAGRWFDVTAPDDSTAENAGRMMLRARLLALQSLGEISMEGLHRHSQVDTPVGSRRLGSRVRRAQSNSSNVSRESSPRSSPNSRSSTPTKNNHGVGQAPQEDFDQSRWTPHIITVKLLGLEGEHTSHFSGAWCKVEWLPVLTTEYTRGNSSPTGGESFEVAPKTELPNGANTGTGTESLDVTPPGQSQSSAEGKKWKPRRSATVVSVFSNVSKAKKSVLQRLKTAKEKVEHTLEHVHGLSFGEREPGVPSVQKSCKAVKWASKLQHQVETVTLPPMVVRSIEQLHNREGWSLDRIAGMFGLELEQVKAAAAMRANFEVAFHQSLSFLQLPGVSPLNGAVKITLMAPKFLDKLRDVPDFKALGMVDENKVVGTIVLKLKHQTVGHDKPWFRRVREVFRREGARCDMFGGDAEDLVGEGQGETAGLGNIVPGVLLEFVVEIRSVQRKDVDSLIDEAEKEDRETAMQRCSLKGFEIVSS